MWEWSHTNEAYDYAREQLGTLPRETLLEIAESWVETLDLDMAAYDGFKHYHNEALSGWIWEQASSYEHGRNCSNGGHRLYLDPQGWHKVDLRNMPDDWQPSDCGI